MLSKIDKKVEDETAACMNEQASTARELSSDYLSRIEESSEFQ